MAGRVSSPGSPSAGQDGLGGNPPDPLLLPGFIRQPRGNQARPPAPPSSEKSETGGTTADRLARMESIVRGENPLDRNRALLAFIDKLAPGDFEQVGREFPQPRHHRQPAGGILAAAHRMGPGGSAFRAHLRQEEHQQQLRHRDHPHLLGHHAIRKPPSAGRRPTTTGDGANPYMPGIIRGLVESDPARATQLLAGMPRSEERGKGLDYILPHLLQQGSEATRSWIAAITDETLRNGAMMRAAEKLAATDPAGTASWLLANPGEAAQPPHGRRLQRLGKQGPASRPFLASTPFPPVTPAATRSAAWSAASPSPIRKPPSP